APAKRIELGAHVAVVVEEYVPPALVSDLGKAPGGVDDVGEEDGRKVPVLRAVGLREVPAARELDALVGFVTHDPSVVPGRDLVDVTGADVDLAARIVADVHLPLEAVAEVPELAARGADDGLHVDGPAPAHREVGVAHGGLTDLDELDLAAPEAVRLLRLRERLSIASGHRASWRRTSAARSMAMVSAVDSARSADWPAVN